MVGDDPDENCNNANNIIGALHRIKRFHDEHPEAARPPVKRPDLSRRTDDNAMLIREGRSNSGLLDAAASDLHDSPGEH